MYARFQALNLDTGPIGLERTDFDRRYFCTPLGAEIIGWEAGGIHYCFVEGFGETVFAVNPMPCTDRFVYPLARTFSDFLRLLLAAKSTTALEQIVWWEEAQYLSFAQESRPEATDILNTLRETFGLTPMEDPFRYVKPLQAGFDDSGLRFSREYYEVLGMEG